VNRSDLKKLAEIRLQESATLLKERKYDGAYYLCGYVIECALKACIAKQTRRSEFPDRDLVRESYTHDLTKLVKLAGLEQDLKREAHSNPDFSDYWNTVKDWNELSRYARTKAPAAHDLYTAVSDRQNGVLQWVKRYW
jgi:hypothetical protein